MREESQTAEQAILRLACLIYYDLLFNSPDDATDPIRGSYLCDFDLLLKEHEFRSQRVLLERMAVSVRRVVGDTCHPAVRCFLDTVIEAEPQLHWFDGFSDRYWSHRLDRMLTHASALEKTQSELQKLGLRVDGVPDCQLGGCEVFMKDYAEDIGDVIRQS